MACKCFGQEPGDVGFDGYCYECDPCDSYSPKECPGCGQMVLPGMEECVRWWPTNKVVYRRCGTCGIVWVV
jgi:hypothetical protein